MSVHHQSKILMKKDGLNDIALRPSSWSWWDLNPRPDKALASFLHA